MPDAWTILKENSSLASGDAWEHLNAQEGGTGPGGSLTLVDGLEVLMEECCFEVEIDLSEIVVEIDGGYEVEVETNEYEVEVC